VQKGKPYFWDITPEGKEESGLLNKRDELPKGISKTFP